MVAMDMFTWLLMVANGMCFYIYLRAVIVYGFLSESYKNSANDHLLDSLVNIFIKIWNIPITIFSFKPTVIDL